MTASNKTATLNLASSNTIAIQICSPEAINNPSTKFDMPLAWCFDLNITSSNAVGTLDIYFQNDDPTTSTFLTAPAVSYPISAGTFTTTSPANQTKQTIDSAGQKFTKYIGLKFTRTSGTGSIAIDGQLVFN